MSKGHIHWLIWPFVLSLIVSCENSRDKSSAEPGDPIKIGLLVDSDTPTAEMVKKSVALFLSSVTSQGGIKLGDQRYPLQIIVKGTRSNPDDAIRAASELIFTEKVVAIVGPSQSNNAFTVAALAEQAHIPLISPGATNSSVSAGKKFVFQVAFNDQAQGRFAAEFSLNQLGLDSAAVVYNAANLSVKTTAQAFIESYTQLGGHIVETYNYTDAEQDFSAITKKIIKHQPMLVFIPNVSDESLVQLALLRANGFKGKVVGGDSWGVAQLAPYPEMDGAIFTHHWHIDQSEYDPLSAQFVDQFRQKYQLDPGSLAALTYDSLALLTKTISDNHTQPTDLAFALAKIKFYRGITGVIDLSQSHSNARVPVVLSFERGKSRLYSHKSLAE